MVGIVADLTAISARIVRERPSALCSSDNDIHGRGADRDRKVLRAPRVREEFEAFGDLRRELRARENVLSCIRVDRRLPWPESGCRSTRRVADLGGAQQRVGRRVICTARRNRRRAAGVAVAQRDCGRVGAGYGIANGIEGGHREWRGPERNADALVRKRTDA